MASGKKIHAGVGSDGSRAKACVGRAGAGAMNLRPYRGWREVLRCVADAAIGAIGVIGGMYVHENFLRKLVCVGAGHPIEPPCVGTMGLSKVYALRAILVTVGKP
jgi:hypothetical protein